MRLAVLLPREVRLLVRAVHTREEEVDGDLVSTKHPAEVVVGDAV